MAKALATFDRSTDKINIAEAITLRYKHNHTFQSIADRFGATKQAVSDKIKRFMANLPDAEEVEAYRQNKSYLLDAVEYTYINASLDPEKVKEASANNIAYSFQQYATQNRLEKGLSTSNISAVELHASISDLQAQAAKLRSQL